MRDRTPALCLTTAANGAVIAPSSPAEAAPSFAGLEPFRWTAGGGMVGLGFSGGAGGVDTDGTVIVGAISYGYDDY